MLYFHDSYVQHEKNLWNKMVGRADSGSVRYGQEVLTLAEAREEFESFVDWSILHVSAFVAAAYARKFGCSRPRWFPLAEDAKRERTNTSQQPTTSP